MGEQFSISYLLKLVDQISTPMAKVGQAFDEVQKKYEKTGKGMRDLGKTMSLSVTAPIMGWEALAVHEARGFSDAFIEMQHRIKEPMNVLQALQQRLVDMSMVTPHSAEGLMEMAATGAKLGIATKDLEGFAKMMMDLGMVTKDVVGEEGASKFKEFADVVGVSFKDYGKLSSVVVELGESMNTTGMQVLETSRQIAGAGVRAGMTTQQIMGLSAWMNSMGQDAGMQMATVIRSMDDAVKFGRKSVIELYSSVAMGGRGMEHEFQKLFKENAPEAIAKFVTGIKKLNEQGVDTSQILEQIGIGGGRTVEQLLRAAQTAELAAKGQDIANEAWSKGTALADDAANVYQSYGKQLDQLKNNFVALAAQFGTVLLPVLKALVQIMQPIVAAFTHLPQPVKILISGVLALAAAVGPLLMGLGMMSGGIAAIGTAATAVLPAVTALATALAPVLAVLAVGAAAWKAGSWISDKISESKTPLLSGDWWYDATHGGSGAGAGNRSSHEVTIKLDKGLALGSASRREGDAKLNVNSPGYMGSLAFGN